MIVQSCNLDQSPVAKDVVWLVQPESMPPVGQLLWPRDGGKEYHTEHRASSQKAEKVLTGEVVLGRGEPHTLSF